MICESRIRQTDRLLPVELECPVFGLRSIIIESVPTCFGPILSRS